MAIAMPGYKPATIDAVAKALQVARDVYGIDTWGAEDRMKKLGLEQAERKAADEAAATDPNSERSKNRAGSFKSLLGEGIRQGIFRRDQVAPYEQQLEKGMSDRDIGVAMGDIKPLWELGNTRLHLAAQNPANKAPTAEQAKAAGFAKRLEQAERDFADLTGAGYNRADPATAADSELGKIPLVGGIYKATMQGSNTKRQEQAERNFVNAVLRRESGASISPAEFSNAEQQYFPRSGDTPEVLDQKQRNREQVMASLKAEAGHAYQAVPLVTKSGRGAGGGQFREGQTATNKKTGERVKFTGGKWVPIGK